MNILVTGGVGYIGSRVCKALAAKGYVPITYDNLSRCNVGAVKWGPLEKADIADRQRLHPSAHVQALEYLLSGGNSCALNLANAHGYSRKWLRRPKSYASAPSGRKSRAALAIRRF